MGVFGQRDQRRRAAHNAILSVGHHSTKSTGPVRLGSLPIGHKSHRGIVLGVQRAVPTQSGFGVFPLVMGLAVPTGALSFLESPPGIEVHKRGVDFLSGEVVTDRGLTRVECAGPHRFEATAAHHQVALRDNLIGGNMNAGALVDVQFGARIRRAVDRKSRAGLCMGPAG